LAGNDDSNVYYSQSPWQLRDHPALFRPNQLLRRGNDLGLSLRDGALASNCQFTFDKNGTATAAVGLKEPERETADRFFMIVLNILCERILR
jgi:hypothetical protein